jgi:EpsI family protein
MAVVEAAGTDSGRLRVRTLWVALAFVLLAAIVYVEELRHLVQRWNESIADSHGFLIAPMVFVLVWMQRDRLRAGPGGEWLATVGLLGSLVGIAIARAASIDAGVHVLMPFSLWFALWLALGTRAAWLLAFPIGYFLFATPLTAYATPVLQWITVQAVTVILSVVGLRAYIVDEFVTVPAGVFEIADGCAGTNYMVVAVAIASLMAFMERLPWRKAAKVLAVAVVIGAVSNWIRVACIIYIGNATDMQSSLVHEHYTFGWWVFAFAMVPFFWYARRVAHSELAPTKGTAGDDTVAIGPRVILAAALLLVGPAWAMAIAKRADVPPPRLTLPAATGWSGPDAPEFDWEPVFPGVNAELLRAYRRADETVDVYVGHYGRQTHGRKLVGYASRVTGAEERWTDQGSAVVEVPDANGAQVIEHEATDPAGGQRIVWSWYEVRGERLLSARDVKLREALGAFGAPARSGIVALSTRCAPDCGAARARLADVYRSGLGKAEAGTRTGIAPGP